MTFNWIVDPEPAWSAGYDAWSQTLKQAVLGLALYYAPQIESWMKDNALWEDRTGNARQALHAEVLNFTTSVVIELSNGMEYFKYLELGNTGRFAIIAPALDTWGPIIARALEELLGSARGKVAP